MAGDQAVHAAILNVMSEIKEVVKDSAMEFGDRYKYASIEGFLPTLREAMRAQGLIMYPEAQVESQGEVFTNTRGSVQNRVRTHTRWRLVAVTDGSSITVESWGEGMDTGDKATNKAATSGLKYALVQTFLLPFQDDPDHQSSHEQQRVTAQHERATTRVAPVRRAAPARNGGAAADSDLEFEQPTGIPANGRLMESRRSGHCNHCDAAWAKGDTIYWSGDQKMAYCEKCGQKALATT